MSRKVNIFNVLSPGCGDPDVIAFFAIADMSEANLATYLATKGLTYNELKTIYCDFVTGCKSDGYWGKIGAIHPFVGDAPTQQKYNLKNPADTDAAFRLSFFGSLTHSATGVLGNGANGYIDTHWNFATEATIGAAGFVTYNRTILTSTTYGVLQGGNLALHNFAGTCQIGTSAIGYSNATFPSTRTWLSYRNAANFNQTYRDSVSVGTSAATITSLANLNFFYLALNNGGFARNFNINEICFGAFINGAFTSGEALAFTARIDALQLALGNNV